MEAVASLALIQYRVCLGIRGDNTVEHAKYLGYLVGKELYPDVEVVGLKMFMTEMLEGRVRAIYSAA
ncbi:isoflavone reductase family protein [Pyrenophora tritici-repentis]|nr:isoflavone reductase family protein [Pyrenophora tritici-repentis]KAI0582204.1 isoflavone reductase family protein [Pyrenophora tritici-repentis]KAI0612903.1 isoflavone reductase family protein [Pyrenophora tritici-repentis]